MNKIKVNGNGKQQFSPWEQSFINLVQSFDSKRRPSCRKLHYLTIDQCKGHMNEREKSYKKQMNRTIFNMSKINLRTSKDNQQNSNSLIKSQSRKYEGPRITFYSKMNPKSTVKQKTRLSSLDRISQRYPLDEYQKSNHLVRDSSIKFLNIVDDGPTEQKLNEMSRFVSQVYPTNMNGDKSNYFLIRKKNDDNQTMRRLKILYNNRKISNKN